MPLDLFSKTAIPNLLPAEMQRCIFDLKQSSSKEMCLIKAYAIVTNKYYGRRFKTFSSFFQIFTKNIYQLWKISGFLHCTNINFVFRALLIKSGFFREEDICLKWTWVWYFFPHQYLQVKTEKGRINVDAWAQAYGIKLGNYAHGFY